MKQEARSKKQGYAAITATMVVLVLSLTLLTSFSFFAVNEVQGSRLSRNALEARAADHGAMEDAIYRVITGKQIGSMETLSIATSSVTITVITNGNRRIIRADAARGNARQTLETLLETNTTGTSFVYGVQAGSGGAEMQNTSRINGSIYANGTITGVNSPTITGDAYAAGTSEINGSLTIEGNAQAHGILGGDIAVNKNASSSTLIDEATVGGHATADTFNHSTINGNAYYKTSISKNTTVAGQKIQIAAAPADLPALPMPIGDETLDQWEADAAAGGTYSGSCPYVIDDGAVELDAQKIPCDFNITGDAVVTLGGTVWVAGNFTIENTAKLQLASSYGNTSGAVIADDPADRDAKGIIDVKNSAQILGSGASGSHLMVISRNNSAESGGSNDAIRVQNSSSASIYYAPHGAIRIKNNTSLKEVTAYKLILKNSATVTYESGLQNVQFSAGPTGGYDVKYWKRTE